MILQSITPGMFALQVFVNFAKQQSGEDEDAASPRPAGNARKDQISPAKRKR